MKHLRKLAGISILMTLIFMVIAIFQFQTKEEQELLPDQITYYLQDDWSVALPDASELSAADLQHPQTVTALYASAQAAGRCHKTKLPYTGGQNTAGTVIFQTTLATNYAGLTLDFSSKNAALHVILDGETLYQYDPSITMAADMEHFVDLPVQLEHGEF